MTESHDYRCWLYHATHAPRIFEAEAEIAAALAGGWVDSPGKLVPVPEAPKPTPTGPGAKDKGQKPASATPAVVKIPQA